MQVQTHMTVSSEKGWERGRMGKSRVRMGLNSEHHEPCSTATPFIKDVIALDTITFLSREGLGTILGLSGHLEP